MKYQKNWLPRLGAVAFITAFMFSACSDDKALTDPQPGVPGDTYTVSMSFIPEPPVACSGSNSPDPLSRSQRALTRTGEEIKDDYVDDIWVLVYDEYGRFKESVYAKPTPDTAGDGTAWNVDLDLTTPFDTQVQIYVLANTHYANLFHASKSPIAGTFGTIENLKKVMMQESLKSATAATTMYNSPRGEDGNTLPRPSLLMRGVGRNTSVENGGATPDENSGLDDEPALIALTPTLRVQLYRLVSRISFTLRNESDIVYPNSIRLCNVPDNLIYFKTATELAATSGNAGYINYPAIDNPKAETTNATDKDLREAFNGETYIWYIPRNILPSDNDATAHPDVSTYIEISGYAIDPDNRSKLDRVYRFYPHVSTAPESYSFNLDGNYAFEYNARITGFKVSDLEQCKHWSVDITAPAFPLASNANCIFVPTSHDEAVANRHHYSFEIAPQIAAYEEYAKNRNLTPNVLLTNKDEWKAEILWMSDSNTFIELDKNHSSGTGLTGEIRFRLPNGKSYRGNAVVELKKKIDEDTYETVWSWHLWVLPYESVNHLPTTTYTPKNSVYAEEGFPQYVNYKEYTMLDYNLGAMATGKPTTNVSNYYGHPTFGLYYQWGRKDPFPDARNGYFTTTDSEQQYIIPLTDSSTLLTVLQRPDMFQTYWTGSDGDYSWGGYDGSGEYGGISDDISNIPSYFTEEAKTPFDPCPVGYRVPPVGAFDYDNHKTVDTTSFKFGYDWSSSGGPVPAVFPASGYRDTDGTIYGQGVYGYSWSASPGASTYGFFLSLRSTYVSPRGGNNRAYGFNVRCVEEKK